jgi:hypothetical protein
VSEAVMHRKTGQILEMAIIEPTIAAMARME